MRAVEERRWRTNARVLLGLEVSMHEAPSFSWSCHDPSYGIGWQLCAG